MELLKEVTVLLLLSVLLVSAHQKNETTNLGTKEHFHEAQQQQQQQQPQEEEEQQQQHPFYAFFTNKRKVENLTEKEDVGVFDSHEEMEKRDALSNEVLCYTHAPVLPTTRLRLHNRRPRNSFAQFSAYIRILNCLVDEISYPTTRRRAIRSRRTSFVSFIMLDTPFQRKHDQPESSSGNQRDGAQPKNSIYIQRIHDRPESSRGNQRVGDNEEISSQRERVDDLDENCPLRQWIRNIRVAAQLENSRLIQRISDQQETSGGNHSVENRDTNYLHGIGERVDDLDENCPPQTVDS
ncbi:hypothetical protein IFM89_029221 [Coptis chinensis]|uniref:Uncharacterized protein n=1 Tax=Coptis chinensis TaxID=261450 RepID=A0A835MFM1_9MAGN|nr:hypothetical protein IFM89_029221 [Coptis chinensis]